MDVPMNNNKSFSIIFSAVAAFVALYCFFNPTVLTRGGYQLAIDGVVVGRTLCLLFGLYSIQRLIDQLTSVVKQH